MGEAITAVLRADTTGLTSGLKGAADQLGGLRGKAAAVGAALSAAGLKAGNDWAAATRTIVQGTGATGTALKQLQSDYQAVASHGPQAAAAVADLNTAWGASGPLLVKTADATLKAQKAFGDFDIDDASRAMQQFGGTTEEVPGHLDTLGTVAQASGLAIGELVGDLQMGGPILKNAGLGFDEAAAFIGKMNEAGVSARRVMPALNMALRRAADEGVQDLRGHLDQTIISIQNAESDTEALRIATETFGAQGAQRLSVAIRNGVIPSLDDMAAGLVDAEGATERSFGAMRTWRDVMEEGKNAVMAAVGPLGDYGAAVGGLVTAGATLAPMIGKTATALGLKTAALNAAKVAQAAFNFAMKANPIGLVVTAIGIVGAALWTWRDEIMGFLGGAWNSFIGAMEGALDWARPLAEMMGVELPADLDAFRVSVDAADSAVEVISRTTMPEYSASLVDAQAQLAQAESGIAAMESAGQEADTATTEWTEGLRTHVAELEAATQQIEAFNIETGQIPTQAGLITGSLGQVTVKAEDLLTPVEDVTLAFGFFEDEAAVLAGAMPVHIGVVNDSLLTVPPTAEEVRGMLAEIAPTWGQTLIGGLRDTFSADNVGATLSRAFEGGGGWMGALQSLGAQMGGVLSDALQGGLDKLGGALGKIGGGGVLGQMAGALGSFLPGVGPILMQGALALGKKIWGGLKSMFGGPSEAVVAARESMEAFAATIDADKVNQDRLADWIEGGFTKSHAVIVTHFQDLAEAQGLASQAGVDLWLRYQQAVEDGDQAAIDAVMGQLEAWGLTAEEADAAAAAAQAYADQLAGIKTELLGLPTEQTVADFEALRQVWDDMSPDERALAADNYTESLRNAAAAGIELTEAEQAWLANADAADAAAEAAEAAAAALAEHNAKVEEWGRTLLGLPTEDAIQSADALREAWDNLSPEQRAGSMDAYIQALIDASEAGVQLTETEQALLDGHYAEQHAAEAQAAFEQLTQSLVGSYGEMRAAAEEAANAQKTAFDDLTNSLASSYMQIRDSAQAAFDEAEAAALESGATQEAAALAGQQAWEASYAEQKAMKIQQLAEEAAFAAALLAIQTGNAAGAAAAAAHAYQQTSMAAGLAFGVIEQAHDAMTTGIEGNYDQQVIDHQASADEIYEQQKADKIRAMAEEAAFTAALKAIQEGRADEAIAEAQRAYGQMTTSAGLAFTAIETASGVMEGNVGADFTAMGQSAETAAGTAEQSWDTAGGNMEGSNAAVAESAGTEATASHESWATSATETHAQFASSFDQMRILVRADAIAMRVAVQNSARDMRNSLQRASIEARTTVTNAFIQMRVNAVAAAQQMAANVNAALRSIQTDIRTTHTIHTVHTSSGAAGGVPTGGGGGGSSGGSSGWVPFSEGSRGIRDFGSGTPAILHGREGVFTQDDIERLIAAAASGGRGGGRQEVRLSADDVLDLLAGRLVKVMPREEARLAR